ncbi:MAG TPA: acyl-ACP--UDP-N-acetylglucosamine O-acyltransferase [Phycisphaerae bacterium]|nr:acyl-ACP--UDP-N-acetylglucosamine O-acyltransferase [Phycisphaerae bacterium]
MPIHATAVIDSKAEISESADIGPYVIIDGPVRVGPRVRIFAGAYLSGWTEIAEDCEIHPHAVVGHLPQDFHFEGHRSYCRIGAGTIIREHSTIHRGTQPESVTSLGKGCFLLANAHVGHNCEIGDNVKLYNNTLIAGHAIINDNVIVSAAAMVHQFCRIGENAFVSAAARIKQDLPPYLIGAFESTCVSYNAIGLRRSGLFSPDEISEVRRVFRALYRTKQSFTNAAEALRATVTQRTGRRILEFIATPSRLGIIRGRTGAHANETEFESAASMGDASIED